jgi:hypothetical protein
VFPAFGALITSATSIDRGDRFPAQIIGGNHRAGQKGRVVSLADLHAGTIMAALDRQHPRGLFDVQDLLANEGIADDLRRAFIVYVTSHGIAPWITRVKCPKAS